MYRFTENKNNEKSNVVKFGKGNREKKDSKCYLHIKMTIDTIFKNKETIIGVENVKMKQQKIK